MRSTVAISVPSTCATLLRYLVPSAWDVAGGFVDDDPLEARGCAVCTGDGTSVPLPPLLLWYWPTSAKSMRRRAASSSLVGREGRPASRSFVASVVVRSTTSSTDSNVSVEYDEDDDADACIATMRQRCRQPGDVEGPPPGQANKAAARLFPRCLCV